uniref:Integrin subunit alpha 2b n=1 Tax=Leptobrachium leishanense TaxID=445787 RepID=A0A8C5QNM2_9ANUR
MRNNMGIRVLLLILPHLATIPALNLDSKHPRLFHGPPGSYFGFSMDFYQTADRGMNIVVGAPKMQTSQSNVLRGGAAFICPWDSSKGNCTMIQLDQTGDTTTFINTYTKSGVSKTDQWLGASVRTWKDVIVVCAPMQHWSVTKTNINGFTNTPTGACYITSNLKDVHEFAPCRDFKADAEYYKHTPDKRFCELGFSAEIHKDGTFLAGGPGGNFFYGLYVTMSLNSSLIPAPSRFPGQAKFDQQIYLYYGETMDTYKGFSVTFGEFVSNGKPELVIASPTEDYMGAVEIITCGSDRGDSSRSSCKWNVNYIFRGDQIAAYFGHSVAVADVNNDGKDDVLIGAPLYMERRSAGKLQEFGRVYVYIQKKSKLEFEGKILRGFHVYGQFGAAIAPLGDLDLDGFPDVAVSAPLGGEAGGGCVYIYRGDISGISSQPSQVIESPVSPPSRFGFSLRGGTDIDGNGYPDLLVGAFENETVYVYRAQPVVVLHTSLMFTPEALDPDVKKCTKNSVLVSCFNVHVCATISGKSLPKNINLIADVQLDRQKSKFSRRTLFHDTSFASRDVTIAFQNNAKTICHNISAYLRDESEFRDKLSPIVVSVNMSLAEESSGNIVQPVLHGTTYLQNQTYILLDCGENNICIPDLHLSATWPSKTLLIGRDEVVNVKFVASNYGDGAYEAELYVRLPAGTHYVQVLQGLDDGEEKIACTPKKENETELVVCEIGNPLKTNAERRAALQLSFNNLENSGSNITFPMQIKSRNSQNSSSPIILVTFAIAVEASLEIRGSSHPVEVVLPIPKWELNEQLEKRKPQDYGEEVLHVFELHNAGPGTVHVSLQIQSPDIFQEDFFLYPLRLEVDNNVICYNQSKLNPLELDFVVASETPSNHSRHGDQRRRRRRETDQSDAEKSAVDGNSLTEEGRKINPVINLNCSGLPCWEVQCYIKNLEQGKRATLMLHSILWIPSFMKRPQQPFTLLSQGSFQVTGAPYTIQPLTLLANSTTTETNVLWVSPDGQKEIPLWWIIVGLLAGLLVLALFIFVMWKLGFFNRMRPPADDQEDLTAGPTE